MSATRYPRDIATLQSRAYHYLPPPLEETTLDDIGWCGEPIVCDRALIADWHTTLGNISRDFSAINRARNDKHERREKARHLPAEHWTGEVWCNCGEWRWSPLLVRIDPTCMWNK